jgi:exo-beta-1,3-glucanase (GH17 family)
MRTVLLALLAGSAAVAHAADCLRADGAAAARVGSALAQVRFVAYQPTALQVHAGAVHDADAASIRADLTVLRRSFDGLITYDAIHGAQDVAPLAAQLKFRSLIIGVWQPDDAGQLQAALSAARNFPQLVLGLSLGNERLFARSSTPAQLAALLAQVHRQAPQLALSVSEPFHIFYQPETAPVTRQLDFMLVNVHPIFQPWFKSAPTRNAAEFVVNVLAQLAAHACGPLLVKETGEPSAPAAAGFSEARQADFYRELRQRLPPSSGLAFAYFSAFDAPWRSADVTPLGAAGPEEAHFGLYDAGRAPKLAAQQLPPLPP